VARIEGTGIVTPSKDANKRMAAVYKPTKKDPFDAINTFLDIKNREAGSGGYAPGRDPDDPYKFNRGAFFSPGGGAFDERNNVQIASADLSSLDVGDSFTKQADKNLASADSTTDDGFNKFIQKDFGITTDSSTYKSFPNTIKFDLKNQYRDSLKFQEGTEINQAPVQEKPSFVEQTKNFAGNIFNTITGTQPAAASQIPGGMPTGTQFTSSNLDAAKAPTGDTSFASYRMAGGGKKQEEKTVVSPTVKPQYEINRTQNRPSVGGTTETGDTSFSAYVRGGGEGQQRGIVSPTSTVAPRQTVASLPSDYKQTEAREFAKAAAFQQAKKNPNVTTSIDSKGQVTVKPVQKTRADAGTSANTAKGNQARVKQNAVARAQAAAINRKISGKSISQVKAANRQAMRDSAAERHSKFKQTGKSTVGARRAAAKASMKAAAKKRHASFKKKRAEKKAAKKAAARAKARANARKRQQRRRGRRRRCDIRCKYNIMPLTNMNLIRDDLAEVAYFVKELQA